MRVLLLLTLFGMQGMTETVGRAKNAMEASGCFQFKVKRIGLQVKIFFLTSVLSC